MEKNSGIPSSVINGTKRRAATNASLNIAKRQASNLKRVSSLLRKKKNCRPLSEEEESFLLSNSELVKQFYKRREKRVEWLNRQNELEDSPLELEEKCFKLAQAIHDAEFLVVYTGAGISTAASIPDYRGPNGVWTRLQKGKDIGNHDLTAAEPTYTHMALAHLHSKGIVRHVVSQNCDGLHMRSGLPKTSISEVHGNMYIEVCRHCVPAREYVRTFDVTEKTSTFKHTTGRRCYRCGEPLVDTIVHFGERGRLRWPLNWQGACQAAKACDTILCLGSSLKVLRKYTWLWQMNRPPKRRPRLFVVNLQWTPKDKDATLKINGKCDDVMKLIMKNLGLQVPLYCKAEDPIFSVSTPLHIDELGTITRPQIEPPNSSAPPNPDFDSKLNSLTNALVSRLNYKNGIIKNLTKSVLDKSCVLSALSKMECLKEEYLKEDLEKLLGMKIDLAELRDKESTTEEDERKLKGTTIDVDIKEEDEKNIKLEDEAKVHDEFSNVGDVKTEDCKGDVKEEFCPTKVKDEELGDVTSEKNPEDILKKEEGETECDDVKNEVIGDLTTNAVVKNEEDGTTSTEKNEVSDDTSVKKEHLIENEENKLTSNVKNEDISDVEVRRSDSEAKLSTEAANECFDDDSVVEIPKTDEEPVLKEGKDEDSGHGNTLESDFEDRKSQAQTRGDNEENFYSEKENIKDISSSGDVISLSADGKPPPRKSVPDSGGVYNINELNFYGTGLCIRSANYPLDQISNDEEDFDDLSLSSANSDHKVEERSVNCLSSREYFTASSDDSSDSKLGKEEGNVSVENDNLNSNSVVYSSNVKLSDCANNFVHDNGALSFSYSNEEGSGLGGEISVIECSSRDQAETIFSSEVLNSSDINVEMPLNVLFSDSNYIKCKLDGSYLLHAKVVDGVIHAADVQAFSDEKSSNGILSLGHKTPSFDSHSDLKPLGHKNTYDNLPPKRGRKRGRRKLKTQALELDDDVKRLWFWGCDTQLKEKIPPRRLTRGSYQKVLSNPESASPGYGCNCLVANPTLCRLAAARHGHQPLEEEMVRAREAVYNKRQYNYRKFEPIFEVSLKSLTYKRRKIRRSRKREVEDDSNEEDKDENKNESEEEEEEVTKNGDSRIVPGWYGKGYRKLLKKKKTNS